MHYPDPFNRLEFEEHLDRCPAHRLSLNRVRDEASHWAIWVREHGLLGQEPEASRWTTFHATAATLSGIVISLLGPLGFVSGRVGGALTGAGFIATVWGLIVSARLRAEREAPAAAAERVSHRIDELLARRRILLNEKQGR